MGNPLSMMYNARGFILAWSGKALVTGVSPLVGHFLPISAAMAGNPFAAQSSFQMTIDLDMTVKAGQIFVMTEWNRTAQASIRYKIDGVAHYPSPIIPHSNLALTEYKQV